MYKLFIIFVSEPQLLQEMVNFYKAARRSDQSPKLPEDADKKAGEGKPKNEEQK